VLPRCRLLNSGFFAARLPSLKRAIASSAILGRARMGDILFAASYWEIRPSPAQRRLFSASARPQARACLQRSRDILKVAPQWATSFILLSVPCHPIACTVAGRLCGSAALAAPANPAPLRAEHFCSIEGRQFVAA
jgi:hypothetical protein